MTIKTSLRTTETVGFLIVLLSVASCEHTGTAPDRSAQDSPAQDSAAGDNPPRLTVRHFPLYSSKDHRSTITAKASTVIHGIKSIELVIIVGKMTDCSGTDGQASAIPCRAVGSIEYSHKCLYSGDPQEGTCSYSVDVSAGDLITYSARAIPSQGNPIRSREITYSGGQPMRSMAVPVYWHTGEPAEPSSISRISLGLFPDDDFKGNFDQFANELNWIVSNAFFNDTQNFAKKYSKNLNFFDIWAVPIEGANAEGCQRTFSGDTATIKGMMSGSAILHSGGFDDCANIKADGDGDGSVDVTGNKPDWLLVHESAHFLFGLADEYGFLSAPAPAVSDPPNIFFTMGNCENTANFYSLNKEMCEMFITGVSWRINDGNEETMEERVYTSNFHNTSDIAIDNRLEQCMNESCY